MTKYCKREGCNNSIGKKKDSYTFCQNCRCIQSGCGNERTKDSKLCNECKYWSDGCNMIEKAEDWYFCELTFENSNIK